MCAVAVGPAQHSPRQPEQLKEAAHRFCEVLNNDEFIKSQIAIIDAASPKSQHETPTKQQRTASSTSATPAVLRAVPASASPAFALSDPAIPQFALAFPVRAIRFPYLQREKKNQTPAVAQATMKPMSTTSVSHLQLMTVLSDDAWMRATVA